jgi:predicted  nucleic acid-binding Zn-ribbon protein
MNREDLELEEVLPLELKLRVLQAELDRLESDFNWLSQQKEEIEQQIVAYQKKLSRTRRRGLLRRVK